MLQNLNVQKNHLDSLLNMQILTSSQDILVLPFCSKHRTVTDHILKGKIEVHFMMVILSFGFSLDSL